MSMLPATTPSTEPYSSVTVVRILERAFSLVMEATSSSWKAPNVALHSTARRTDHAVNLHRDVARIGHASSTTMSSAYLLWRDGAYPVHFDRREPRCFQPAP